MIRRNSPTRPGHLQWRPGEHAAVHGAGRAAEQRMGELNSQELANTVWAFAMDTRRTRRCSWRWQGQRSSAWASSIGRNSPTRPGSLQCRQGGHAAVHGAGKGSGATHGRAQFAGTRQHGLGVCNGDQADAPLFTALARAAEQRMGELNSKELANSAWAFSWRPGGHAAVHGAGNGSGAAHRRAQFAGTRQHGLGVCNLYQADTPLFTALARAAEQRTGELNSQELANTA